MIYLLMLSVAFNITLVWVLSIPNKPDWQLLHTMNERDQVIEVALEYKRLLEVELSTVERLRRKLIDSEYYGHTVNEEF